MSTEETISTAPEIQNPAPEATSTPDVAPEATSDAAPEGDSTEQKPEKTAEQKELEYLRRKATKAERNSARLYQEAQSYREQLARTQPASEEGTKAADPYEMAREIAALDRIDEKSNSVAKDGEKRFGDFNKAVRTIAEEAGPLFDNRGKPTNLGEALLESDDPAALMHFLGTNPALADELNGLTPTQLGRRIERFEAQMKAPKAAKPASNAPPPIKPLSGGTANANRALETASMDEYKALRAKQGARWAR